MKFLLPTFLALLPLALSAPGITPLEALDKSFNDLHAATARTTTSFSGSAVITTRNELQAVTTPSQCKKYIVIFARGTSEPGNVGDDVGPMFFDALEVVRPGQVLVQGVNNYKADIWGYLGGGSKDGARDMTASVASAVVKCPSSRIVLSGFSQGAQVVHRAAALIPVAQRANVGAIVLFGDPNDGDAFPGTLNNNVKTFCNDGDLICDGLPIPTEEHGLYELDAEEAAAFVISRIP